MTFCADGVGCAKESLLAIGFKKSSSSSSSSFLFVFVVTARASSLCLYSHTGAVTYVHSLRDTMEVGYPRAQDRWSAARPNDFSISSCRD